jgi:hypothetical protein
MPVIRPETAIGAHGAFLLRYIETTTYVMAQTKTTTPPMIPNRRPINVPRPRPNEQIQGRQTDRYPNYDGGMKPGSTRDVEPNKW